MTRRIYNFMFGGKKNIRVTIKFYSGLDRELQLRDYDPEKGVTFTVREGTKLRTLLKSIGFRGMSRATYVANGKRVGPWTRLKDGDDVSCLSPSGGG